MKNKLFASVCLFAAFGLNSTSAQTTKSQFPDITSWPKASQMAVKEMMDKYGDPDGVTPNELTWMKEGQWEKICVTKMESDHNFPLKHTDMLTQYVSYKVPADKMDELTAFDGSVVYDRTQGLLSARCDKQMNNVLALNLAHDIASGKKSTEEARKAFADIAMEKMKGGNPEYMQKLMFKSTDGAADADVNTTGMDKEGNKVASTK